MNRRLRYAPFALSLYVAICFALLLAGIVLDLSTLHP
jgi:hypothetical protein